MYTEVNLFDIMTLLPGTRNPFSHIPLIPRQNVFHDLDLASRG